MNNKFSKTIEDYLGILFILERDGEVISGTRLAELLGVSPPTVTNTLKRMIRDGLVDSDKQAGIRLTQQGLDAACTVMRRHMLTEWMLSKLLSWSKLHNEAHLLEHAISDEVEAVLMEDLNHPQFCPHGNPLPGNESLATPWKPLNQIEAGSHIIIRRIHELAEEEPQLLCFLEEKGITPGQEAFIESLLPFNQTVCVNTGSESVTLGFSVAKYIFAEPAAPVLEGSEAEPIDVLQKRETMK